MSRTVTMKGAPLSLIGPELEIGQPIPDATLLKTDLSEVSLSSFKGKKLILSVVPSLDTSVCDLQTKRFNAEAANLGDDVVVITVSADLPFAQARWCGATGSDQILTVSDHRSVEFGEKFGVLIDGLRLLGRAIFIVDAEGVLNYQEIVPELTTEPNYEAALDALKAI